MLFLLVEVLVHSVLFAAVSGATGSSYTWHRAIRGLPATKTCILYKLSHNAVCWLKPCFLFSVMGFLPLRSSSLHELSHVEYKNI